MHYLFCENLTVIIDTRAPIHIKRIIVEKHENMRRWEEEVSLLRREMVNFIMWYMDITIPRLMKIAKEMQAKIMVSSFIVKSTITFGMSRVFDTLSLSFSSFFFFF